MIFMAKKNSKFDFKSAFRRRGKVKFIFSKGGRHLFSAWPGTGRYKTVLAGQEGYFSNLAHGVYRFDGNLSERTWKFLFKHLFVAKEIFRKMERRPVFVLDIGCSRGYLTRILESNLGKNEEIFYYGLDLRLNVLKDAVLSEVAASEIIGEKPTFRLNGLMNSVFVLHNAATPLPFKDDIFDFVVCFQMTKYLPKNKTISLFKEIHRVMKRQGHFFMSTDPVFDGVYSRDAIAEFKKKGYKSFWTSEEIVSVFKKVGLNVIKIFGAESSFRQMEEFLSAKDRELVGRLGEIFPQEIIEAILGFFYPQSCLTKLFLIKK